MKPVFPRITGVLSDSSQDAALSRRSLLKWGAAAAGTSILPLSRLAVGQDQTPHFFLHLCISGGLDASYTFDARPLKMTDKNKIQNYLYKNNNAGAELHPNPQPILLEGSNGNSTLRTPLTNDLVAKHWPDFSVVNGVCMLTNGFVGHGNNMYYLYTNSANPGRDSFIPLIGARGLRPLESVHIGGFDGDGNQAPTNFAGSIQLFRGQGGNLANALKSGPQLDLQSNVMKQVMARLAANAQGTGMFSVGSKKMQQGLSKGPALAETLKNVTTSANPNEGEVASALDIALAYFRGGVTSTATIQWDRDPIMDTHDGGSASQQPKLFAEVMKSIELVFDTLKSTVYDQAAGLSFFDVTTLLVTTEFSRTMIQIGADAGSSGTDHNPLTNTALVAGKGIKGGLVVGASDLGDVDDAGNLIGVSEAHKLKDQSLTQIMGRPFDFETFMPRTDLPATFKETDYLCFPSVANTLMTMFGVSTPEQFRINGVQSPILKTLLK